LGKAFQEETGTKGVLFLSFELYDDTDPPKIALTARLVSTGQGMGILWMDGVAMAGNDSPGILGLGRIRDSRVLWEKAREKIVGSLAGYLAGKGSQRRRGGTGGKYRPKSYYKGISTSAAGRESPKIAVLPFRNESTRRNAGEIMALHFLRGLSELENLKVIEPGEVRQALLMSRTIMAGGLSLPQADVLQTILDADLVLMGSVTTYEDYTGTGGNPKVNFSVQLLDMKTRRVTWSSISHNQGVDGVFFFDLGKVNTAHAIASAMSRAVTGMMLP
jgi:TolB-like protein